MNDIKLSIQKAFQKTLSICSETLDDRQDGMMQTLLQVILKLLNDALRMLRSN
jgi:hypothetical protein